MVGGEDRVRDESTLFCVSYRPCPTPYVLTKCVIVLDPVDFGTSGSSPEPGTGDPESQRVWEAVVVLGRGRVVEMYDTWVGTDDRL